MSQTALHDLFYRIGQPAAPADASNEPLKAARDEPPPAPVEPPPAVPAAPAASAAAAMPAMPATPADVAPAGPTEKMGERFIRLGLLTEEQVQHVVQLQQTERLRFGQAAVKLGFVSEERVQSVLAEQYHYDYAPARQQTSDIPLAIASAPFSQEAEAIRQLRAEISIQLEGQPRIAIAIVSPEDGEGRAYLSASLAVAFAQTGRSTLLVNANLRTSGQRDLLGDSGGAGGLSSILAGRSNTQASRAVPGFPMLAVLDAGPQPPNPAELLREPALGKVLEAYAGEYEIFIVNTPAMNHSSDAQSIARQLDACVMIARRDVTRLADLERCAQSLETSGVRVLGTVYNEYDPQDGADRGLWARARKLLPARLRR